MQRFGNLTPHGHPAPVSVAGAGAEPSLEAAPCCALASSSVLLQRHALDVLHHVVMQAVALAVAEDGTILVWCNCAEPELRV